MGGKACGLLVAAALALPAPAWAGATEAIAAWGKGDYAGVLRECEGPAKAGEPRCANFLGILYAEGKGVPADQAAAVRWFRLAAESGNPTAEVNLGIHLENGRGVAANPAEAEKWFRKAADQGQADGEFLLGFLLIKQHEDWKAAIKLFRKAAAQGLPDAQSILGFAYESGKGVKQNPKLAAKWFEPAADHGITAAQSRLAGLYERGDGVETDFAEAYFWYSIAIRDPKSASQKADQAGQKRVAARLNKTQLADAETAIKEFTPEKVELTRPSRRSRRSVAAGDTGTGPRLYATGSGFYVNREGSLVTNNHVVAECREVRVTEGDKAIPAKVVATDAARDLALVQLPHGVPAAAIFRASAPLRPGENVVVVGFPLSGLLTSDPIITTGIISALAGPQDDRRRMQISAPIQPGNSGGPVFDSSGNVIGIAVAVLNSIRVAKLTGGVIPENIGFAIKAETAQEFLAANGLKLATAAPAHELSTATIAEQAIKMTVRLECWK